MTTVHCMFAMELPVSAAYACRPHGHPCTELVLSRNAIGAIYCGADEWIYGDGTLFIYQPGDVHGIRNQVAGTHYCVGVNGCGAETLPPGAWGASDTVISLVMEIIGCAEHRDGLHDQQMDLLSGLLVVALRRELDETQTIPVVPAKALEAKELIDAQFDRELSVGGLASALFISPDYLRQLFKSAFDDSPMQYLIRRRIQVAQDLLCTTDLPINAVARRVGIDNPYYFSRLFKKVVGQTPSQWRGR